MELRKKEVRGCCFECIDFEGRIIIAKHNNTSCFSSANGTNVNILNIYEPKKNIDLSVEDIYIYLELIKQTGLFLDIEFIPDYNENEYKFVIKKTATTKMGKFRGTYTVIRYLWGDEKGSNFDIIPPNFIRLAKEYPNKDLYSLLQIAHLGLPLSYNSNHALLCSSFTIKKTDDVIFSSEMNSSYGGSYVSGNSISVWKSKEEDLLKLI